MKKILLILIFLILVCSLTGCNDNKNISFNESTNVNITKPIISTTPDLTTTSTEITITEIQPDYSNALFASPSGGGNGTIDSPCSILEGINKLNSSKNKLYLYSGTYNLNAPILLRNSTETKYEISAFQDEKVILDFGKDYRKTQNKEGNYNSEKSKGIVIKGNYYHIKGITITNCGAHGLHISGSYNKVENCIFAYNGNTGLNISSGSNSPKENWAHDNLVLNCTSYGNYDWDRLDGNEGEDADGFGSKLTSGANNVFDGCISYNNSDDGWDFFTKILTGKIGSVTIKNSVAFRNGYSINGEELKNGNGFKLGGRAIEVDHFVYNSIAFNNKSNGFDDNSNPGKLTLENCTAYNNGNKNYAMGRFLEEINTYKSTWYEGDTLMGPIEDVPKSHNNFNNCISYKCKSNDTFCGVANNCYFYNTYDKYQIFTNESICNSKYNIGSVINSFNPFESLEIDLSDLDNIHYLYRNDDYSVNLKSFLKLKEAYNIGANLQE